LYQSSFGANSKQVTNQQHFEQHDRINAGSAIIFAIQRTAFIHDKREVNGFDDFPQQVILEGQGLLCDHFWLKFSGCVCPEHRKPSFGMFFIPIQIE
jgi:hypothetical protein